MPGLFGVFLKKPGRSKQSLLHMARSMGESMRSLPHLHMEVWGDDTFAGGRVHLGVLNPDPQPLIKEDEAIRAWFDGEWISPLRAKRTTPDVEEISALVSGCGRKLAETDGVFNLAVFDSKNQQLLLANDRLALRPLYYTETDHWFAYAGEVKALLAICDKLPDLDEVSLRQFFGFGHMLGERTWWRGIESLLPGSLWRISRTKSASHEYWTFEDIHRKPRNPDDVEEEFGSLWSEEVRRHSKPGMTPLLLSGGLDSRLLLAELCEQDAKVVAITCGSGESPDMKIAVRVAKAANVEHRRCYLHAGNWWDAREESIRQTDGLVNAIHFHFGIAAREMNTGNRYSPMNIAGDLLFGGSHLNRNGSLNSDRSPNKFMAKWYLENPFFAQGEIFSASSPDMARYVRGPSSDCFHLSQRMRRLTLTGRANILPYCEITFPGVSRAMLQLMLGSLSDQDRFGSNFYNRFLAKNYPKLFGNIPWQSTGRGLAESLGVRLWKGAERRGRRLFGLKKKRIDHNRWFVDYPGCVRESRIREKLLSDNLIIDQYLAGAARRTLLDGESPMLNHRQILGILTVETYLRQVAGHKWSVTENRDGGRWID